MNCACRCQFVSLVRIVPKSTTVLSLSFFPCFLGVIAYTPTRCFLSLQVSPPPPRLYVGSPPLLRRAVPLPEPRRGGVKARPRRRWAAPSRCRPPAAGGPLLVTGGAAGGRAGGGSRRGAAGGAGRLPPRRRRRLGGGGRHAGAALPAAAGGGRRAVAGKSLGVLSLGVLLLAADSGGAEPPPCCEAVRKVLLVFFFSFFFQLRQLGPRQRHPGGPAGR